MNKKFDFATLAGLLTWLMVYGISVYVLQIMAVAISPAIHVLFLAYGGLFWLLTRQQGKFTLRGRYGLLLLSLQLLIAFCLLWLLPARNFEFLSILTIIWAAMLPIIMRTGSATLLALLVVAIWHCILAWQGAGSVWITAILYGCFHLFAVLVQSASHHAEVAKQELEQKHLQLLATQQLLQGASRQSERTRIARNLHDVVGHHLTALTIQLQVAGHVSSGEAKTQIEKCHQLAKLLLSDVREAVSTMRQYADLPLQDAIAPLLSLLPEQLEVELDIPADIMLNNLQQAQHLLCIVQEAISNSLKHSAGSKLVISASIVDDKLQLIIYDNGKLAANWAPGNGITGMQERLAECSGQLQLGRNAQALMLTITLPYMESDNA